MKVRVTYETTITYQADVSLDEALISITADEAEGGVTKVRQLFDPAKLAEGQALTGNEWVGGETLSEMLWCVGSESDSSETRVVSVRRLDPPRPERRVIGRMEDGTAASWDFPPEHDTMRPKLMGAPRQPGVNVDKLDVDAAMAYARTLMTMDERTQMLLSYALQRWARGEEEAAELMVVKGVDGVRVPMTTWRMILAAARAAGEKVTA